MKYCCINSYMVEMWINVICDMGGRPHLQVNINKTDRFIDVPSHKLEDGVIRFNVSPNATQNFRIDKESGNIMFDASFSGESYSILIPAESVEYVVSPDVKVEAMMPSDILVLDYEEGFVSMDRAKQKDEEGNKEDSSEEKEPTSSGKGHLKVIK